MSVTGSSHFGHCALRLEASVGSTAARDHRPYATSFYPYGAYRAYTRRMTVVDAGHGIACEWL